MVSGNVLYMTRELGGSRGWAGEMEGADHFLLWPPWQGPGGGVGRWSQLTALLSRLRERQPRVADKLVLPGYTSPVTLDNSCPLLQASVSSSATWYMLIELV